MYEFVCMCERVETARERNKQRYIQTHLHHSHAPGHPGAHAPFATTTRSCDHSRDLLCSNKPLLHNKPAGPKLRPTGLGERATSVTRDAQTRVQIKPALCTRLVPTLPARVAILPHTGPSCCCSHGPRKNEYKNTKATQVGPLEEFSKLGP